MIQGRIGRINSLLNYHLYPDFMSSQSRQMSIYRDLTVSVDAIITRPGKKGIDILLITRGSPPFIGYLAFPGGYVDYGEDPKDGCLREVNEECGVEIISKLELLNV